MDPPELPAAELPPWSFDDAMIRDTTCVWEAFGDDTKELQTAETVCRV